MLELTVTFWNQERKVSITRPNGTAGLYHLKIDGYYIGQIVRQQGELLAFLNPYPDLPGDDLQVIFYLIEEEEKKKPR